MKLIHIADLHLGKQMGDRLLLEEQEAVLQQIVSIAADEKADGVLIAGDVYQRSAPQAEAMTVFDHFVSQLVEMGKKVFIISGNHDSAQRISYFSALVRNAGVYVTETFDGHLQSVTLEDRDGPLNVWLMPFLRPTQVKRLLPEAKIVTYQDAVTAVLEASEIDYSKRNVLLCHQFISGCETTGDEEKAVGGLDQIDGRVLEGFDYVALGHIHGPQKVLRETMRYAGSPLKYSFSEVRHKKAVTVVDLQEKGEVKVKTVPLYPLHDVRLVEGMLADVMEMDFSDDFVWVTIHDELPPPDAKVSITNVFPNMLKFSVVNSRTKYDMDVQALRALENKKAIELFCDFYRLQNNDQLPNETQMKILEKITRELEVEPDETL